MTTPASFIPDIAAISLPSLPLVMQPVVKNGIPESFLAISKTLLTIPPLSIAGIVLGMATTPVTPPLIAALVPVLMVSFEV